jgi:uncharacterized membrane protein
MDSPQPEKDKTRSIHNTRVLELPIDMKIISLWTALCIASIFFPDLNESFFRLILSLPLILFIPGYLLMAVLFPRNTDIDTDERLIFSIGISVTITPLIGLFLNYTTWGIRLNSIITGVTTVIIAFIILATIRRSHIPPESRYTVPILNAVQMIQEEQRVWRRSRKDRILTVACIFSIGLVILSVILVSMIPKEDEKFTEFYILGENRTADSYPRMIFPDKQYSLYYGIGNREYRDVNYTVEIYLVGYPENSSLSGQSQLPDIALKTDNLHLTHNQTSIIPFVFMVNETKYNRLDFLLFDENVPNPGVTGQNRMNTSYRSLHLWLNVTQPDLPREKAIDGYISL